MKTIISSLLILSSFYASAQGFAVTAGKKILGSGNIETGKTAKLPNLKKIMAKALVFTFKKLNAENTASNVSIMAMDANSQEIGERITVDNYSGGAISFPLTNGVRNATSAVSFYILRIPTDPNVAATVRVRPELIATCK
jgi:hypothetical protein